MSHLNEFPGRSLVRAMGIVVLLSLGIAGCGEEEGPGDDNADAIVDSDIHMEQDVEESDDVVEAEDVNSEPGDMTSPEDVDLPGDGVSPLDTGGSETKASIPIGDDACCLSVSGEMAIWAEAGDLRYVDLNGGDPMTLVSEEGTQTDPVISGDRVVWADDRDGDFDLYMMDLVSGETQVIVAAPGDQRAPTLDGDHLAWIDKRKAPHGAAEAEIYFLDLADEGGEPLQITDDIAEQDHVFIQGGRMVWSDYSSDPDRVYLDVNDPNENNADIMGYDIDLAVHFTVTDHPSKQLRPAIEGDTVVWLDWRGIQPEPKYSEFGLYTTILNTDVGEQKIAVSSWNAPELWVRPLIHDGVAAWIAEDYGIEGTTRLFLSVLGEEPTPPIQMSGTNVVSVDLREGLLSWMDFDTLTSMTVEHALDAGVMLDPDTL